MLQYIGFLLKAGDGYQESQVFQQAPSSNKEKKKRRGAPRNQSGYQIFLKKECARLKADHQDIRVRKQMAIDTWKKMSDIDKKVQYNEIDIIISVKS